MTLSQALWALVAIAAVQATTDLAVLGLGRREALLARWLPYLVSGAAGVLLATACLDLLPEGIRQAGNSPAFWRTLLAALLALFCLQLAVRGWGHDAEPDAVTVAGVHTHGRQTVAANQKHDRRGSSMSRNITVPLLLGSTLHSIVDGIAIAAAFAAGRGAGWSAAMAVGLHEFPHRLGDFTLLLHSGMERRKAAQLALGAGAAAFAGGLAVTLHGQRATSAPWLIPVSAATFLYIALVDLLPEIQAQRRAGRPPWEVACLLCAAALMAVAFHLAKE